MKLHCEVHEIYIAVSKYEDFDPVKQGGCNIICGELRNCGHVCKLLCYSLDREHVKTPCREPCTKLIPHCSLQILDF